MITKTGEEMLKRAGVLDRLPGLAKGTYLTLKDRKTLKEEYDLPDDAFIGDRTIGRGIAGGVFGGLLGDTAGRLVAKAINRRKADEGWTFKPSKTDPLIYDGFSPEMKAQRRLKNFGRGGAWLGGALMASLAASKYSKWNAERIRARNATAAAQEAEQNQV